METSRRKCHFPFDPLAADMTIQTRFLEFESRPKSQVSKGLKITSPNLTVLLAISHTTLLNEPGPQMQQNAISRPNTAVLAPGKGSTGIALWYQSQLEHEGRSQGGQWCVAYRDKSQMTYDNLQQLLPSPKLATNDTNNTNLRAPLSASRTTTPARFPITDTSTAKRKIEEVSRWDDEQVDGQEDKRMFMQFKKFMRAERDTRSSNIGTSVNAKRLKNEDYGGVYYDEIDEEEGKDLELKLKVFVEEERRAKRAECDVASTSQLQEVRQIPSLILPQQPTIPIVTRESSRHEILPDPSERSSHTQTSTFSSVVPEDAHLEIRSSVSPISTSSSPPLPTVMANNDSTPHLKDVHASSILRDDEALSGGGSEDAEGEEEENAGVGESATSRSHEDIPMDSIVQDGLVNDLYEELTSERAPGYVAREDLEGDALAMPLNSRRKRRLRR